MKTNEFLRFIGMEIKTYERLKNSTKLTDINRLDCLTRGYLEYQKDLLEEEIKRKALVKLNRRLGA